MKNFSILMAFIFTAFSANAQIFTEDFEAGLPAGWTQLTMATDGGWVAGNSTSLSTQYWAIEDSGSSFLATNDDGCNCDKSADYIIFPTLDLSAGTFLTLDLVFAGGTYQGNTEVLTLEYSTDGGATFTSLQEIAGNGTTAWRTVTLDLTSVTGTAVNLALKYNDGSGWLFGAAIDNISIAVPPNDDVALSALTNAPRLLADTPGDITGTIDNLGGNMITSVDVTWSDGTNIYAETLTGLSIAPLTSYDFTHGTQFSPALGVNSISVDVTNPNGVVDTDPSNNSMDTSIDGVPFVPTKAILFEEATGTWCQWCPRGHVYMEYMEDTYDDFLGVAVHNNDPMTNTAYDAGYGDVIQGYPSGSADRNPITSDIDPSNFELAYNFLQNEVAPVAISIVSISSDNTTRELTVEVSAEAVVALNGDYRFGLILTENDVTGTTSGYSQSNAYSGGQTALEGAGHNWQTAANPVAAADMVYDHVGREVVGGFTGMTGSLPAAMAIGDVNNYTFTYTVPTEWDTRNMHLIATVHDNTNSNVGRILNAIGGDMPNMEGGVANENLLPSNSVKVFPNPASDVSYIRVNLDEVSDVSVQIFNNLGQSVYSRDLQLNGDMVIPVNSSNFASGIYQVNVNVDGKFITKKLVIK